MTTKPSQKLLIAKMQHDIDSDELDNDLLTKMFQSHPRFEQKCAGRIITKWKVRDKYRGIHVVFENGERETVSWRKMVQSYCRGTNICAQKMKRENLTKAFRCEVNAQIVRFRQESGVDDTQSFHVGHNYQKSDRFIELVKRFITMHELVPENIAIVRHTNRCHLFHDRRLGALWRKFHKQNAILRMEAADENVRGNVGFRKEQWF